MIIKNFEEIFKIFLKLIMKSLALTAYNSIILNENFVGLRRAIVDLQNEENNRRNLAMDKLVRYFDENKPKTNFLIHDIRDNCTNDCGGCEIKHYPVLTFKVFFNLTGTFCLITRFIINIDNSMILIIETDIETIRIIKAMKPANENVWNLTISIEPESKLIDEILIFIQELYPIINIYFATLNKY